MTISKTIMALGLNALLLASCGGDNGHDNTNELADSTVVAAKDTTAYTVSDTTKFKFDFAIANIPSPANTLQDLAQWGIAYDPSILNDSKKSAHYTTEFQRSINLGVYNIDMAYAMVNDKGADVLQYMKNIMMLSDALGLKGAMNAMVGKRAQENINNKDSLFGILDEIFVKSDIYLRTNERVYTAGIIFAGSWLESLYIASKLGGQLSDANLKVVANRHLWEQRMHLGNLINLLGDYKDKKECAALIADLKPIDDAVSKFSKPTDMSDADFKEISTKIIVLRNKLIN